MIVRWNALYGNQKYFGKTILTTPGYSTLSNISSINDSVVVALSGNNVVAGLIDNNTSLVLENSNIGVSL